jgi:hypothetical protein
MNFISCFRLRLIMVKYMKVKCLDSKVVMSNTEAGGQDTKDQKGLCRCLVLDIIVDGVGQKQGRLEINLWQEKAHQDGRIGGFSDREQVQGNTQLGKGDRPGANFGGSVDTKGDREGVEAHGAVTFNGFKIIDNGNSQTGNRVEDRTETNKNDMQRGMKKRMKE